MRRQIFIDSLSHQRLNKLRDKRLKSFELCKSDSLPALFLQDPKPAKFRVLIAAGFHGNKPAGPVGLNKWAKNLPIDL